MIAVDRNRVSVPESLLSKGKEETEKALAFYLEPVNQSKSFSYKAYSADDVKLALDRLFHGKCAYCESAYASVHPMDVEHWRPKGLVSKWDGERIVAVFKPGYYWLAAEWTNLLPSCIDCNRQRYQLEAVADPDAAALAPAGPDTSAPDLSPGVSPAERDALLRRVRLGKKNLFPVKGGLYADTPEKFALQPDEPLLLNSCQEDPAEYLEFVGEAVVRPRSDLAAERWEKAHHSIVVYGLNRSRLVYERKERLLQIQARIYTIQRLAYVHERLDLRRTNDQDLAEIVEDLMEHEMRILRRFTEPEQPFAQMARQIIERFFASF